MPPREGKDGRDRGGACLDVWTRGLTFIPRHTDDYRLIYFHIGTRLFALGMSSFQYLDVLDEGPERKQLSWCHLPKPPFCAYCAVAHAVHHDKQTIFVSFGLLYPDSTYSFHMTEDGRSSEWKHVGDWILPFHGRGYFDPNLNTWIGLSMYGDERGHIFSCQLEPATTGHRPDVKHGHEYLLSRNPGEEHVGATLVCMGRESKYCLVESVAIYYSKREADYMLKQESRYVRYMFRLTTFSLEYNENGDIPTGHSQRVRYYFAPKNVTSFACKSPVAFFI
ncbi:unnamed protein product [Urochloa decumbens]|uniref:F-box protein n=1 Tax=Urochloa decumbens TaxID=240449 RepID=A0ABC8Y6L4_9POAL